MNYITNEVDVCLNCVNNIYKSNKKSFGENFTQILDATLDGEQNPRNCCISYYLKFKKIVYVWTIESRNGNTGHRSRPLYRINVKFAGYGI